MNSLARTENFAGGSGKIISAIWECRTSALVQSTPRAIRCQQPLLRVPIQRPRRMTISSMHSFTDSITFGTSATRLESG